MAKVFTLLLFLITVVNWPLAAFATPVAYWRFENNYADSLGTHHAFEPNAAAGFGNNPPTPFIPNTGAANLAVLGLTNPATQTSSANQYLHVPHSSDLNLATGSFTLEAWVSITDASPTSNTRAYLLMKKGHVSDIFTSYTFLAKAGDAVPAVSGSQDKLALGFGNGTNLNYIVSTLSADVLAWHHISVAVDHSSGDVRFTVDDQVDLHPGAALGITRIDNSDPLVIGAHPAGGGVTNYGATMQVDELRISNSFLPTSQLLAAVPEPGAVVLAVVALAALGPWYWWRHRRNSHK